MKKTFKEIKEIDNIHGALIRSNPGFKETKLGYALKRFTDKNLVKIYGEFNDALNTVRIDNALTDKDTGAVLYEAPNVGREFKYDKEGLKNVIKAEDAVLKEWESKEFELEVFICKDLGKVKLTDDQKEALAGVVI